MYVDFQRARKHRRELWATNTLRHIANCIVDQGKPCLSTPTIMEIVDGLKPPNTLTIFRQQILPTFEIIGFDEAEACLAGEIYRKLETQRQRIRHSRYTTRRHNDHSRANSGDLER